MERTTLVFNFLLVCRSGFTHSSSLLCHHLLICYGVPIMQPFAQVLQKFKEGVFHNQAPGVQHSDSSWGVEHSKVHH